MSSAAQPSGSAQPFKILSLDDGDVGGLSSLLILEKIMENIQNTEDLANTPKPCDIFDLIGGTGTGGIIAIMLGRLGMSVGDCIETYKEVSREAFAPKNTVMTRLNFRSKKSIPTAKLESALKKAIRENCPIEKCARERDEGQSTGDTCQHESEMFLNLKCVKTVVLATTKVNIDADPILFRTYRATASLSECKIWEVGRATSAMASLFKPIKLGRENETFINSSFGHSNPCKILIEEASELLSDQREKLILSIGTGLGGVIEMGDGKKSLTDALNKIATRSKGVANELERKYRDQKGRYHRFDTANSQGAILASNRLEPSEVAAHTKNYVNEKRHDIQSFAKILINGFPLVSEKHEVVQKLQLLQPPQPPQQPKKSDSDDPVAVYHIPFHENLGFVGRQDVLSELDNRLFTHTGFQQVALVGLGGMGKTQVALKFAYTVKEKYTDCSVFWVTAASIDGFRNSCKELTASLGIETSDGDDPRILVKDYLDANKCGKWLLILDNVDDDSLFNAAAKESRISAFLPQSKEGRIVFTTRSKTVSWLAARRDSIELEEMSSEELTTILMPSVEGLSEESHVRDENSINELLNELCHFPLAVAQAADYMAVNQISIAEYLELLRGPNEGKIELMKHNHVDNAHLDDSQGAVATTWFITFRQIEKTSSDAVDLLRFIAKVEAKAIPQTMLPDSGNKKAVVDAIGILLTYGFIRRQKANGLFDMHSLVHLITQLWCKGREDENGYMSTVFDHMASIFPSSEWENRFLWRQYLPHALCVAKNKKASGEGMALLEFKVGRCLYTDGNFRSAVTLFEHVVKTDKETLSPDHPDRLASQHALAQAYLGDGQIKKAISMFEHVVDVREALASDDPSRLASQHELARAYLDDGQIKKAISMVEHVVDVQEALAADHPSRLTSQHELAQAYLDDGQIKKAISMFEHVVKTEEKVLAADNPHRLASQHALARAYLDDGQIKKAISMLEHVVDVRQALAADHPSRLASQHALARAYLDDGQIKKAISMFEHVVDVRQALAADHPSRLASQHALARAYLDDGQIKKAILIFEHVVDVQESLAADHPDRLVSQHELARAYLEDGQIKKAISMFEHVVDVRQALAADDPSRLASQHALARAYLDDGQIRKAISMFEHVVNVREALAPDHPSRLSSQHVLARAYLEDGRIKKSISMFEHVVKTDEKALAADNPNRLKSQHWLAQAYLRDGQIDKAISMFEHVVDVHEALAADHPDRLISQQELARAYFNDGQIKKATSMLEHVVELDKISSTRNLKDRLQAQELLKQCLTRRPDSQDLSS